MKFQQIENGVRAWAPAKINLFFEILFKRSDGYHEIETLVAPISIFDALEIKILKNGEKTFLECVDAFGAAIPDVPTDKTNLVWRAADAFFDELGEKRPLSIKILKKIPSKAGLGGGSSDAATTLAVLNELCGGPFTKERLQKIGGTLGSDVPLFLERGASIGRGRGELVEPFDLPNLWLVVVKPPEGLSTPAVFRRYSKLPPTPKRSLAASLRTIEAAKTSGESIASAVASVLSNRLEEVARTFWDGVEQNKSFLNRTPNVLGVQMTGSGTAFFAIFPDETSAKTAATRLLSEASGKKIFVAQTL